MEGRTGQRAREHKGNGRNGKSGNGRDGNEREVKKGEPVDAGTFHSMPEGEGQGMGGRIDSRLFSNNVPKGTCPMCGKEDAEMYAPTRELGKVLCSRACSEAYNKCRFDKKEDREKFIREYRSDPKKREKIQREIDETQRIAEQQKRFGFEIF